ncbi:DUF4407 domain-containing protein [Croceiramulus getboli]|nr:DUF4407 domain-containing protein [Flavobacteriaceae bacterium YJPT1-3]
MIKKFFLLCSGADLKLLENCSNGEQNKYAGIGATVFFTAVMAFIAASYALYTVFDNPYRAILFGLLWGLLIFNLDRFIVSTLKKRERKSQEILQAVPRILLAVIIAVVISKPLELKIFEKEISQVLLEEKNDLTLANKDQLLTQYQPALDALDTQIADLKQEIADQETETNALYETYIAEAEGRKGTEIVGKGPVYKEKREKHDAALAELQELRTNNNAKIATAEEKKELLAGQYESAVATSQPIIDSFDGLMARVNALNKLPWWPSFFIFLLFLAVETAPILAKLMSPRGEYDIKISEAEETIKAWAAQKAAQRKILMDTDHIVNDKVYGDLSEEEELYNYKKKMAREIMKRQQDAFYRRQTKILG